MTNLRSLAELCGRILLMALFLISGISKIAAYAATAAYMSAAGVPSALLPAVIGFEILGALAIMVGWQTRFVALLMSGYTLTTALLFHVDFANQVESVMFLKNLSIAGAFLMLAVNGPGRF